MGQAYTSIRSKIVECLALLEAYIDFPEEDIPESVFDSITRNTTELANHIAHNLADNHIGERIRSGFRVAIVGAPNVGKSSLLNMLAKRDAAIVSATPGTTRDVIEVPMNMDGYAVIISDTAGIRETSDEIESIGISRSKKALSQSDMAIILLDASNLAESLHSIPNEILQSYSGQWILCINKSDLSEDISATESAAQHLLHPRTISPERIVSISVKNASIQSLERAISAVLHSMHPAEEPLITQSRHRTLLTRAHNHLQQSLQPLPLELRCEELRLAAHAIGQISGVILPDELLGEIFSKFCIGK
jgi:tRNA modification GTPase